MAAFESKYPRYSAGYQADRQRWTAEQAAEAAKAPEGPTEAPVEVEAKEASTPAREAVRKPVAPRKPVLPNKEK